MIYEESLKIIIKCLTSDTTTSFSLVEIRVEQRAGLSKSEDFLTGIWGFKATCGLVSTPELAFDILLTFGAILFRKIIRHSYGSFLKFWNIELKYDFRHGINQNLRVQVFVKFSQLFFDVWDNINGQHSHSITIFIVYVFSAFEKLEEICICYG